MSDIGAVVKCINPVIEVEPPVGGCGFFGGVHFIFIAEIEG